MKGYPTNVTARADHLAVTDGTRSLTYDALDARTSRLAHVLGDLGVGVGAGDLGSGRLAIMLPNSVAFVECLAASAKLGVASVTLNWHLTADEVAWILEDSGAQAVVALDELRDHVAEVADRLGVPAVWVGGDYDDRLSAAPDARVEYRWPSAWPVLYTSGTSGRPKGVVHGAMAVPEVVEMTQEALAALWGYTADDVHIGAGPMYHAGPAGYINSTLFVGGTVVLMPTWDPAGFLRLVEAHRATTTFLTPAHFIRLLELPTEAWDRHDVSSLRHVLHAGAPCPVAVKQRIIAALPQAEVWELYGASEGGATKVGPVEWLERPGTVGRPWPGVEVRVLDPVTTEPKAAGEDGLVWVKPAHGQFEYHNDPEKTANAWHDGAFTVGDVGHLDDDGYLYLTDRQSDMIIRAGVNLYPREVEDVLYAHPAVVDCAVFGVPDDRDGEHPVAVVESRSAVTAAELESFCRDRLEPYKVPTRFDLVDVLPRDPNGKVLKRLLRDQAWAAAGRRI